MAEKVNYTINFSDDRFEDVQKEKQQALSKLNETYDTMINQSDSFYNAQIDASKQWVETQKKNQQEQTDFAIEQINQQKEQAKKDYTKEQSGAYVDWQKQSNQYGVNAEQMAAQGMQNTGYSESSQVSMYNTYQNRVATAREAYSRAVLNYDNAIKDARLQNNAALAEIAYQGLQAQLELSLEGFQYKNGLIQEKTKLGLEVDNTYYNRYQDVLQQINTENALAEEVRQYNKSLAEEQRQYNESLALDKKQLALQQSKFNWEKEQAKKAEAIVARGGGGGGSKNASRKGTTGKGWVATGAGRVSTSKPTNTNSGKSKEPTVDMNSVLALGFGPISAATLNDYVRRGIVQEYESGGKLKYKKTASTLKQSMLFQ